MLYMTCCWKWCSTPIKLSIMLYVIPDPLFKVALSTNKTVHHVIPDTLLKVVFNTNKTGHHVIPYIWHIVESGIQHQQNWPPCYTLYLIYCWKWRSTPIKLAIMLYAISDILLKVAFRTNKTPPYDTFYMTYCWKWCSTPIILATMLYIISDTLMKVVLNTNKTGHHVIRYNWHIVETGIKHQ